MVWTGHIRLDGCDHLMLNVSHAISSQSVRSFGQNLKLRSTPRSKIRARKFLCLRVQCASEFNAVGDTLSEGFEMPVFTSRRFWSFGRSMAGPCALAVGRWSLRRSCEAGFRCISNILNCEAISWPRLKL